VHSAANPLTAHFDIVHGVAVGIMLPHVIRFNAGDSAARERYAALAVAAGIAGPHLSAALAVEILLERIGALLDLAGIPCSLRDAGVTADGPAQLAPEAARQWTASFNPRTVQASDFEALYTRACEPR